MFRKLCLAAAASVALAACATGPVVEGGVYRISSADEARIQFRMLDAVNALRAEAGVPPVELDARLTAAAEAHARDMSRQQRAWPFGSDTSSPYDRVQRSGYPGALVAEVYAQTYETELATLAAWVDDGAWGPEILSPEATDMGFAWRQDPNGLLWWAIVLGDATQAGPGPA